jgi:hypothetical protein
MVARRHFAAFSHAQFRSPANGANGGFSNCFIRLARLPHFGVDSGSAQNWRDNAGREGAAAGGERGTDGRRPLAGVMASSRAINASRDGNAGFHQDTGMPQPFVVFGWDQPGTQVAALSGTQRVGTANFLRYA